MAGRGRDDERWPDARSVKGHVSMAADRGLGGGVGRQLGYVGKQFFLVGKAGEEQRKRQAAERRHAQERAEWERQRQLEQNRLRQERQQSQGQSSDAILVSETQRSLIRLGYDPGRVGTMNPQTTEAIKAYQASKGLLETGRPSQELLTHMIKHGG